MKLEPWSVRMRRGGPKMEMMERIALDVSSEVYDLRGIAKGKPEASSRHVRINLYLCLEVGRGPTMSRASFSPRSDIISGSSMGTLVAPDLLKSVHFLHDWICFLMSEAKFGQVKCLLTKDLVVFRPPCPRPSCAATRTLSLSGCGTTSACEAELRVVERHISRLLTTKKFFSPFFACSQRGANDSSSRCISMNFSLVMPSKESVGIDMGTRASDDFPPGLGSVTVVSTSLHASSSLMSSRARGVAPSMECKDSATWVARSDSTCIALVTVKTGVGSALM